MVKIREFEKGGVRFTIKLGEKYGEVSHNRSLSPLEEVEKFIQQLKEKGFNEVPDNEER